MATHSTDGRAVDLITFIHACTKSTCMYMYTLCGISRQLLQIVPNQLRWVHNLITTSGVDCSTAVKKP